MDEAGRTFRAACRTSFRWLTAVSLVIVGIFSPLRATEHPPDPEDETDSSSQGLEFTIKPSAEGMVLTWFGELGVPFQVQSSTDLKKWTDVGPIIGGTNGWVTVIVPTTNSELASFDAAIGDANGVSALPPTLAK